MKTPVIIVNTGTPDDTSVSAIRRYLSEFLNDARVIDKPALLRKFLVNGVIVPFRSKKTARLYEKVWTDNGSPLLWHSENLKRRLQWALGDDYDVKLAMRYGNPSLKNAIQMVKAGNPTSLFVLPLFPQYASATTGSIMEQVFGELRCWNNIPQVRTISQFYDHRGYIDCIAEGIQAKQDVAEYSHILFSFHSLPVSHVYASHGRLPCERFNCTVEVNPNNAFCYRATCYATARALAIKLGLRPQDYSVGFQSQFAKKWISPFTDQIVRRLAHSGVKSLLVVSPSFVTDCLETILEIGEQYRDIFLKNGGEQYNWVPGLNDSDNWVKILKGMITGCK